MSKVDEHVRRVIAAYPETSRNRFDVLHHIFCVGGNGYKWVNGVPVSDDAYTPWTLADENQRWSPKIRELIDVNAILLKRVAEIEGILSTIDARVKDLTYENSLRSHDISLNAAGTGVEHMPVYQQHDAALLLNLPADIDPEWAAAAASIKPILASKGWQF